MQVLLVDDDARLRQVLARLLQSQGFDSIVEASDGEEALALLVDSHPDLIVTDCQMPRMDGITFVRALRARGDKTPVLILSGQHDPHFVVNAVKAGVTNYVPKPINPEALFEKVWQTLGTITVTSCK